MEEEDPVARKKRKQYEAYRRWYTSQKGADYRQRQKERLALGPQVDVVEITSEPEVK
jgi:transposase